jgi:PadR family transcriptional regulator, regulatory protein PadR
MWSENKLLRNIKTNNQRSPLLDGEGYGNYLKTFESQILRGIGTLCVLNVIKRHGENGTYGYEISNELLEITQDKLVIEEGTLYPILKKLEKWGSGDSQVEILKKERREIGGRKRNYYSLTPEGKKIYDHMEGFFSVLIDSISNLLEFEVELDHTNYLFCPNCGNKAEKQELQKKNINYCEVCGYYIKDVIEGRGEANE